MTSEMITLRELEYSMCSHPFWETFPLSDGRKRLQCHTCEAENHGYGWEGGSLDAAIHSDAIRLIRSDPDAFQMLMLDGRSLKEPK